MIFQLFLGSVVLLICSALSLIMMLSLVWYLRGLHNRKHHSRTILHMASITALSFTTIIAVHTLQVWIWALSILAMGALPNLSDSVYFAVSTYTTVGYGDIILAKDMRIFGSMASINGMLAFGISTAFLVNILTRIFPKHLD